MSQYNSTISINISNNIPGSSHLTQVGDSCSLANVYSRPLYLMNIFCSFSQFNNLCLFIGAEQLLFHVFIDRDTKFNRPSCCQFALCYI